MLCVCHFWKIRCGKGYYQGFFFSRDLDSNFFRRINSECNFSRKGSYVPWHVGIYPVSCFHCYGVHVEYHQKSSIHISIHPSSIHPFIHPFPWSWYLLVCFYSDAILFHHQKQRNDVMLMYIKLYLVSLYRKSSMLYVMTLGFRFDPIYSKVRVQRISRDENIPSILQVRKQNPKQDRSASTHWS